MPSTFIPQNSFFYAKIPSFKMKKYLTEFIGTFFWVLTVVLTANNAQMGLFSPLAIGLVVMAMLYASKNLSGAHFNPAVTIAALIGRNIDRNDAIYYIMAQLFAGVVAAAIGVFLHESSGGLAIAPRINESSIGAVFGEFLGTFALVYVYLNVLHTPKSEENDYSGWAVGGILITMMYTLNGLSGTAFNPAVALGACMAGMFGWDDLLLYTFGPILGGGVAATLFQYLQEP